MRGTRPAPVVREGVLPRVAVIALGAVLLVVTIYLVVQVNDGPHLGEASLPVAAIGSQGGAAAGSGEPTGDEPADPGRSSGASAAVPAGSGSSGPSGQAPASPAVPATAGASGAPVGPLGATATTPAMAKLSYDEAYKLYDRHDYEEARALALSLMRNDESMVVKMRRIVVASSCAMGDQEVAQQYYLLLPEKDRGDMRQRCAQYGAGFREQ